MNDERVIRSDGWVAIKYLQTIPHVVAVNGHEYLFTVRNNVNMVWVSPGDVDAMMAVKKECCGGHKHQKYTFANQKDVELWA